MERMTVKRADGRWAIANNNGATPLEQTMKIPIVIDRLAYYEDLEEQGRLFIPPVAIGKSVWCISKASRVVSQYTVAGYLHDGIRWKVRLTKTIPSWVGNKTEHKYVAVKAFGITCFLTREEAKQALEGGAFL